MEFPKVKEAPCFIEGSRDGVQEVAAPCLDDFEPASTNSSLLCCAVYGEGGDDAASF